VLPLRPSNLLLSSGTSLFVLDEDRLSVDGVSAADNVSVTEDRSGFGIIIGRENVSEATIAARVEDGSISGTSLLKATDKGSVCTGVVLLPSITELLL